MDKQWNNYLHFSIFIFFLLSFGSCQDEEESQQASPSTVSFESINNYSSEGSGIHEVKIQMDHPQKSETMVNFTFEGPAIEASYSTNGFSDYELLTPSPAIIKAGETSTTIRWMVEEDVIFENEKEYFTIHINGLLEGNARLVDNPEFLTFTHTIRENDFQIDLLWDKGAETEDQKIDFYLEAPGNILLSSLQHELGKTILLTNAQENGSYYLEIGYEAQNKPEPYTLTIQRGGLPELTLFYNSGETQNDGDHQKQEENYILQNFRLIKNGNEFILFQ